MVEAVVDNQVVFRALPPTSAFDTDDNPNMRGGFQVQVGQPKSR